MVFRNRTEAGLLLAKKLMAYAHRSDVLVLALPRGGVAVAFEVARELDVSLDVFVVRKLGVPGHEELAMGAIAMGGVRVLHKDIIEQLHISDQIINQVAAREEKELKRRESVYRGKRPLPKIAGCVVVLIDDGIATGSTMRAAVAALRQQKPARMIVAVPTVAPSTYNEFKVEVDEMIALITPEPFYGVGEWYEDFSQMKDKDVCRLLAEARV